ncbi:MULTISPECIES: hypothetical protein [Nitrosopumilus]|uniref:Uncharacterized protein n=1 Tax=Nitrosopumilus zosterae TaxID=718286 RepID=A0A2S2KR83_9ARCH|nr:MULTISPECIES: hypothetical protein [Nitrosopumilus]BDQ30393.1 hypothetical protein NZOSNM25_000496 [Nitrosopumilus zosterae]GBH34176.1 hypothetical protein NZNM25_09670 [Nitrosopumilus zosterae]
MEARKIPDREEAILLDMTFCCKGICENLELTPVPTSLRYRLGHKRCTMCSIFVETEKLSCPCCGVRLRTKSRNKKHSEEELSD